MSALCRGIKHHPYSEFDRRIGKISKSIVQLAVYVTKDKPSFENYEKERRGQAHYA